MAFEKAASELFGLGPSAAHRESVHRTWFGTLLGESVVLLGLVLLYGAAVFLLLEGLERSADVTFEDLITLGGWPAVTALFLAVPAAILVFKGGPAAARAARARRLRPLATNPAGAPPGYFRLHPYEAGDSGGYVTRTDLRDRFIRRMLEGPGSVYYLSGASGVGKSSLVATEIIPAFTASGWKVLDARGLGDSFKAMADAVGKVEEMLESDSLEQISSSGALEQVASADGLYERTLSSVGRLTAQKQFVGLLFVVDQFEEFLLLEDPQKRADFADILCRFSDFPVPRVKLLLVFRDDYRALLFKQGLPDYLPGKTGFEIAPFTRSEAEAFLNGGPKLMDSSGYEALFRGLDRVEETRGLYRPITLNMVGLVLSRTGVMLTDNPTRLIERYLADCLAHGRSRDFAKPVLEVMITTSGTKEPLMVGEIADLTGLDLWQVQATLVDLQQNGLVRPLAREGMWEVSHDFLARILSGMLGHLKEPVFRRAAPWVIGLTAIGWGVSVALAAPLYLSLKRDAALAEIGRWGINQMRTFGGGYSFAPGELTRDDDLDLIVELAVKGGIAEDVVEFSWPFPYFDNIAQIATFKNLEELELRDSSVSDLSPLADLSRLERLFIPYNKEVIDLRPIVNLDKLYWINLSGTDVIDLAPLGEMKAIDSIELYDTEVQDFGPIACIEGLGVGGLNDEQLESLKLARDNCPKTDR